MIRRLCAGTAGCLLAALVLVACGTTARTAGNGTASGAHPASPPAAAGAQNLRVSIDLALVAHLMLMARTTGAALGVRTPEFSAYGTALHANDATVADTIVPAGDPQGQNAVDTALTAYDKAVLDFTAALYTKDTSAQHQAAGDLSGTYVPQMRSALMETTHAGAPALTRALDQQVTDTQTLITAQSAGNWTGAFQALSTASTHQVDLGTSLSRAMARTYPHRYPGHPLARATTLRTTLESQLQMQAYLLGMEESAAAGGRSSEQQAAAAAYAGSNSSLSSAISPAGSKLAGGVSSALSQAQGAAAALALATAHHDTGAATTQQQTLTRTFPNGYADVVHKQLGGGRKEAVTRSSAFGAALAKQATAEGQQQSSPQLTATAAATAATLGRQLGAEVAARHARDFPSS